MVDLNHVAPGDGEDNVAEHVRIEREARQWSTAELARRVTDAGCPMSQSAVWRIENGEPRRKISVDELIAFSKVFGRTIEYLLKPAHPEFPEALIRVHLMEWMKQEIRAWDADREADMYVGDLEEMVRIYPGAMPYLSSLLDEALDEQHLTFLRSKMAGRLRHMPKRLADNTRRRILMNGIPLIAYWNEQGLSLDEMMDQAEKWGFENLAQVLNNGSLHINGRSVPIERLRISDDGSVEITS